ncbi:tyrosine-type recombinase/integrase [Thauera chlorobenzoica]|uniref:Putative phage integrase n=1 Tax=Thauera chlorobenzoica TaxID=96773 RepID=A0A1H5Z467_9RHOO|nr:integrase family protein [Thauera chlorobenzoica]APR05830.1 putative phage integrase [Thauera chlorobenzoica]SEG30964.1 protein of unknown function [Thauera chlorobenzoica]
MARIKLTNGRVGDFACPPDKLQAFLWDTEVWWLAVRAQPGGTKTYVFQARFNGSDVRVKIGDVRAWNLDDARAEARRMQTLIDKGIDPRDEKRERIAAAESKKADAKRLDMLVGDAWDAYIKHHERRWGERHLADHRRLSQTGGEPWKRGKRVTVQGVLYPLLQLKMREVTATALHDWQVEEVKTRANNARQGFELFRAFWRWCASRPEYADVVDLTTVENRDVRAEVPRRKTKRFDVLERAHLASWFAAVRGLSNPVIGAYLQGLLLTGCRREELAELKWSDVDFRWGSMWVKDKVEADGRKIPLTPYLRSLISALPRRNAWVFSSPTAADGRIMEPRIPHNRALAVAGLDHVTLHGLRRTFASLAEWVEMPTGVVAQIMGHKPNATAERHYINRPLELLAVWHTKYESWILEQAGIEQPGQDAGERLKVVG